MSITHDDIKAAQAIWGQGIVEIGDAFTNGRDYVARAEAHIRSLYAYGDHEVLFKPTKCARRQFRPTFEGALSYFVSGNPAFPEDKGFAIAPYTDVKFAEAGHFIHGDCALAMGNYFFTDMQGVDTKVEYSFGYVLVDGALKINLHHSSLPFSPG